VCARSARALTVSVSKRSHTCLKPGDIDSPAWSAALGRRGTSVHDFLIAGITQLPASSGSAASHCCRLLRTCLTSCNRPWYTRPRAGRPASVWWMRSLKGCRKAAARLRLAQNVHELNSSPTFFALPSNFPHFGSESACLRAALERSRLCIANWLVPRLLWLPRRVFLEIKQSETAQFVKTNVSLQCFIPNVISICVHLGSGFVTVVAAPPAAPNGSSERDYRLPVSKVTRIGGLVSLITGSRVDLGLG
jgi:hypothetical protein